MSKKTSASMGVLDGLMKKAEIYDSKCVKVVESINNNETDIFAEYDNIKTLNNATTFIIKKEMSTSINQFLIAHALKKVKDNELYKPKYDNFYDYIKCELPYQKTQVYGFVRIAETYPVNETSRDIIQMGMTKLQLLTGIENDNIVNFINEKKMIDMSVRDIKKFLKNNSTDDNESSLNIDSHIDTEIVLKFQKRISLLSQNISDIILTNKTQNTSSTKTKLYNNLVKAKKDIENIISDINISEQ